MVERLIIEQIVLFCFLFIENDVSSNEKIFDRNKFLIDEERNLLIVLFLALENKLTGMFGRDID